jgi:DNA-binding response OmpR family regulator
MSDDTTTILLIEDDREISATLQRVLEASGYKLSVANNGVDGRRLADSVNPDLVITDMMMPRMGGFPVLEHLKSKENGPKIIMITANEGGRHKAYAEMLGVDAYIRKPFAMDVLLDAIEQILGKPSPRKLGGARSSPGKSGSPDAGSDKRGPLRRGNSN